MALKTFEIKGLIQVEADFDDNEIYDKLPRQILAQLAAGLAAGGLGEVGPAEIRVLVPLRLDEV